jgi:hypothetical protein
MIELSQWNYPFSGAARQRHLDVERDQRRDGVVGG